MSNLKWIPLPVGCLPYKIMLFTAFSSNTSDNIDDEYNNYVMPTVIENVNYTRNSIYQTNTNGVSPLGSYTVVIDMNTTKFYRMLEGVKSEVEYLDPLSFGNKGFDEQTKKYFTIQQQTSSFILGIYEKYNNGLKVEKKNIRSINFKKTGFALHTITNIDIGGFGSKPDLLTLTGSVEV